jgi:hypothetical protein
MSDTTNKTGGATSVICPTCGRLNGQICCTSSGRGLWGKPHAARRKLAAAADTANKPVTLAPHDRPMAAAGLKSYRYKGRFGWIMIGATDDADAMQQARRSIDDQHRPHRGRLEAWNGSRYVPMLGAALRDLANGIAIAADEYSAARDHAATTNNDKDALMRVMYGSPLRGDRDRVRDLATEIEERGNRK